MDINRFSTLTLQQSPYGFLIKRVLSSALLAVDPAAAVTQNFQHSGNYLLYAGQRIDLNKIDNIYLLAIGKAGYPMARSAIEILGERLTAGIIITKEGYVAGKSTVDLPPAIQLFEAGHPIPDKRGEQASWRLMDLLHGLSSRDLIVCLISGGGSALLTAPAPGIILEDLQQLTSLLLACGAPISEINTLRKHVDELKGGKLARLANPALVVSLILSDVVGDPLDMIASGPTAPDKSTFADCLDIINKYNLRSQVPSSILQHLSKGKLGHLAENPKPGNPLFSNVHNLIVGNNTLALQATAREARILGISPIILEAPLQGEAREAGYNLAVMAGDYFGQNARAERPACIICGGETTVTLRGRGFGGSNQELALAAVKPMSGLRNTILVAMATDGGDGPTDAAGAVVSGETYKRAQNLGLDPHEYLERNDSYHFFSKLEDLLITGPTQTNVNDLAIIIAF